MMKPCSRCKPCKPTKKKNKNRNKQMKQMHPYKMMMKPCSRCKQSGKQMKPCRASKGLKDDAPLQMHPCTPASPAKGLKKASKGFQGASLIRCTLERRKALEGLENASKESRCTLAPYQMHQESRCSLAPLQAIRNEDAPLQMLEQYPCTLAPCKHLEESRCTLADDDAALQMMMMHQMKQMQPCTPAKGLNQGAKGLQGLKSLIGPFDVDIYVIENVRNHRIFKNSNNPLRYRSIKNQSIMNSLNQFNQQNQQESQGFQAGREVDAAGFFLQDASEIVWPCTL